MLSLESKRRLAWRALQPAARFKAAAFTAWSALPKTGAARALTSPWAGVPSATEAGMPANIKAGCHELKLQRKLSLAPEAAASEAFSWIG